MASPRAVRLGEVVEPAAMPGLVAERDRERIGLLTYIVDGDHFEVLSLHCRVENAGAGSALLEAAAALAAGRGCRRLWLVTTNDNLHALVSPRLPLQVQRLTKREWRPVARSTGTFARSLGPGSYRVAIRGGTAYVSAVSRPVSLHRS